MKYVTQTTLRFKSASGKTQEICEGLIVSFDEGDQVDTDFLVRVGAIKRYEEPVTEPEAPVTEGGKRGRSSR